MSAKLLLRLAVALGVLVVAWGVLALVRRPPSDSSVALALAKVDTAAVDSISLIKVRDTMVLSRAPGARARWMANGFQSDSAGVQTLLKAIADTTNRTELVAESRTSHTRLGVTADSGTHLVVFGRGGAHVLDLVAGNRTSDYGGVHIRRPVDDAVYALKGLLVDPLTRAPSDLRDKRVAAVPPESVTAIQIQRGGKRYKLERSGTAWTLSSGKAADSVAVSDLLGNFRDLRSTGFATKLQGDSLDFKKTAVHLASKSGGTLLDLALDSTASGQWARPAGSPSVFKMDSWLWGRLVPAESTLAAKLAPKKK
jgi:hypothetical protein